MDHFLIGVGVAVSVDVGVGGLRVVVGLSGLSGAGDSESGGEGSSQSSMVL